MTACGVEGCHDLRVMGTPYCHKHATIESRTHPPVHLGALFTGIIASLLAVWCLYNSSLLADKTCKAVDFDWGGIITGAFVCVPPTGAFTDIGSSWLAAPGGVALSSALSFIGFSLFMTAAAIFIVLWNRSRRLV